MHRATWKSEGPDQQLGGRVLCTCMYACMLLPMLCVYVCMVCQRCMLYDDVYSHDTCEHVVIGTNCKHDDLSCQTTLLYFTRLHSTLLYSASMSSRTSFMSKSSAALASASSSASSTSSTSSTSTARVEIVPVSYT